MDPQKCLKVVKIVGVFFIAYGVIAILTSIMGAFGYFAMLGMTPEQIAEAGLTIEGSNVSASSLFLIIAITSFVEGVLMIACGFFGFKANEDFGKVKPLWIISLILLVIAAISLIFDLVGNGMSNVAAEVVAVVLTGLMFYAANVLKKQIKR